jgi:8-oxo-dGTP pyrophosphatase MutT (NUDIX family)
MTSETKTVLSAGAVVVRREGGEWQFLLLRAYKNWDFPKGIVEPGEDSLQTALREVREEAGLVDLKFSWGKEFKETEPYNRGRKIARYYLAETAQTKITFSINPDIGAPEHHEYRWLAFPEVRGLAPERLRPVIEWAHGILGESGEIPGPAAVTTT